MAHTEMFNPSVIQLHTQNNGLGKTLGGNLLIEEEEANSIGDQRKRNDRDAWKQLIANRNQVL